MGKLTNGRPQHMIELINEHEHPRTDVVQGLGFRFISKRRNLTSSHCQELSPRELYIRHKTDGKVNYYFKLNL